MLNVLYAGSPEQSAFVLSALAEKSIAGGYRIAGVLTNPPARKGRHAALCPTSVQKTAEALHIPVFTPERLTAPAREAIAPLGFDLLVCFAYGRIFGPKFMALFRLGGVNLHPSLLPLYRGAAPVQSVILHRETETGVSVQKIAEKMDSGAILAQERIALCGTETASSLLEKSARIGAELVHRVVSEAAARDSLPAGTAQDETRATYCELIRKEDGRIDWRRAAAEIGAQVRAFDPWPSAYTLFRGTPLKILCASVFTGETAVPAGAVPGSVLGVDADAGILVLTGCGILAVCALQLQAKKAAAWKDFINGARGIIGCVLGDNTDSGAPSV